MAVAGGPNIVEDGLVLYLDAANPQSYPGSGTTWYDLSGNSNHFTVDGTGISFSNGIFELANGGTYITETITTSPNATCIFWMKTTDNQSLFLSGDVSGGGSYYLGAYRIGNKEYYSLCGSPQFYMDTVNTPNIYDYGIDGQWHMFEFKNVNFQSSPWPHFEFNKYSGYTFGNGAISSLLIYEHSLTPIESLQNYNATKARFGL